MNITPYIKSTYPTIEGNDRVYFDTEFTKIQDCLRAILSIVNPLIAPTYTVLTLPGASLTPRAIVYVSNETGGATLAFSDGTNWRRVQDRAIVS